MTVLPWRTAIAICIAAIAVSPTSSDARGLLGLFAEEKPAPEYKMPAAQPAGPDKSARPVAFVNSIRGIALPDLQPFDLVYPGQRIELGSSGETNLTFLSPCRNEIITGGTVTLLPTGLESDAQAKLRTEAASCRPFEELPDTAHRGAVAPDDGPFQQQNWHEDVVNGRPVFKWDTMPPGAVASVSVWELDHPEPRAVWETTSPYPYTIYPADAYVLKPGQPYRVAISVPGTQTLQRTFSIDLDLSFSRTPLNQMIWVSDHQRPTL